LASFDLFRHFRNPGRHPNPLIAPRPNAEPIFHSKHFSLVSARIRQKVPHQLRPNRALTLTHQEISPGHRTPMPKHAGLAEAKKAKI
jgi:hypothetical protein